MKYLEIKLLTWTRSDLQISSFLSKRRKIWASKMVRNLPVTEVPPSQIGCICKGCSPPQHLLHVILEFGFVDIKCLTKRTLLVSYILRIHPVKNWPNNLILRSILYIAWSHRVDPSTTPRIQNFERIQW